MKCKFIHVADVHLGAKPDAGSAYSAKRKSEIWDTFGRVIELCEKEQADLLLIAGDLFHRQPLYRELKEVDYLFGMLTRTRVVLVAGNHDYLQKNSYYRTFPWNSKVHMILSEDVSCVQPDDLDVAVYGLSYGRREISESLYDDVQINDTCRYHILLAHGGDEKHIPFRKSIVDGLGFDYVALGHTHKPQTLIPNRMIYAGALEPIDVNDTGAHGVIMGMINEHGCRTEFVPMASREYIHLTIEVEEELTGFALRSRIREEMEKHGMQHIYKLTLEGFKSPDIQYDLHHMDTFGNIIEIVDHTKPAFDFVRLMNRNRDNLMGRFIASFGEAEPESTEYEALCEGVQALMETKR